MPTNTLVAITPSYCLVTRYGASYMTQILDSANGVGLPYVDLHGAEATRTNFENAITTNDPILVNIMGHGSANLIVCQNNETLLQGGINTNILSGRVVYDLSCQAGRELGRTAFNEGAISFLGYTEDFWVCYSIGNHSDGGMLNPLDDEVAKAFFEPHNAAPISYIRGSTIPDSYFASQNNFDYWISVWEEIDSQVAALIVWNRDYQILYSSEEPTPPIEPTKILPALLMFAPLLLIPVFGKK